MMEILGSRAWIEGGRAAMGSSRYSFTSSSLSGTEAQKYEKVLLRGIISPRNRSANCPTLSLDNSNCADIEGKSGASFSLAEPFCSSVGFTVICYTYIECH